MYKCVTNEIFFAEDIQFSPYLVMRYLLVFLISEHSICPRSKTISDHPFRKRDYPWSRFRYIRELWRRPYPLISWGPSRLGEMRACCLLPPASFLDCLPYLAINITIFVSFLSFYNSLFIRDFISLEWTSEERIHAVILTLRVICFWQREELWLLLLQDIARSSSTTLYLLGRYELEWYLRKVSPT